MPESKVFKLLLQELEFTPVDTQENRDRRVRILEELAGLQKKRKYPNKSKLEKDKQKARNARKKLKVSDARCELVTKDLLDWETKL